MSKVSKSRNYSLDLLKGICAILVVFIHANFPNDVGNFIVAFSGMAVPVFFLTSGFFSTNSDRAKLLNSIKHILSLICVTYLLNFVRIYIQEGFSLGASAHQIINAFSSLKKIILFFGFNVTVISGVAWFLFALLYCYIFNYIFLKFFNNKYILYLCASLGFLGGIIVKIVFPVVGISFSSINNIWFCGMPYFCLGKLVCLSNEKFSKIANIYLIISSILGFIIVLIGFLWLNGLVYLGNFLSAISIFVLSVNNIRLELYKNRIINFISKMGNQYAFLIYIIHPLVIHVFSFLLEWDNVVINWFYPIIILFITILISVIFIFLKSKFTTRTK